MIPGNHDFERNFYLGDSLEGWFYYNPNVFIDNGPSPRKYFRYNNVLIGLTHGDQEPINNLPLIMAQERPSDWGATKFREFHLGHLHHSKNAIYKPLYEHQGVMIRHMSSLTMNDAWHHRSGYVGSRKAAEAYLWDNKNGLKSIYYYTAE